MKKILIVPLIILSLIVSVIAFFAAPWIILYAGMLLSPAPPPPEIQYGEFPFRLEYEIDGKVIVVEDTVICRYDGVGMNEAEGKYHKWKTELANGNQHVTLLKPSDTEELYFSPGIAEYYMDWLSPGDTYDINKKSATHLKTSENITIRSFLDEDELLDRYKIRIINWEYSQPINQNRTDSQ